MTNTGDYEIGQDGKAKPTELRTKVARALLAVLRNPQGVETIDWELADAAIVALSGEQRDICIDCDGKRVYPSGAACKSCDGTGFVNKGDGIPVGSAYAGDLEGGKPP